MGLTVPISKLLPIDPLALERVKLMLINIEYELIDKELDDLRIKMIIHRHFDDYINREIEISKEDI